MAFWTIAGGLLGLGSSLFGSRSANKALAKAVKKQYEIAQKVAAVNKVIQEQSATEQSRQLAQRLAHYQQSIRASAGERGFSGSGSEAAAQIAVILEAINQNLNIQRNMEHMSAVIDSQAASQSMSLKHQASSQLQNPLMSGIMGGLQGLQMGLNLAHGLSDMFGGGSTTMTNPNITNLPDLLPTNALGSGIMIS